MSKSVLIISLLIILGITILTFSYFIYNLKEKLIENQKVVEDLTTQLDMYNLQIINNENLTDMKFQKLQLLIQDFLSKNKKKEVVSKRDEAWQTKLVPDIFPIKDKFELSQGFSKDHSANDYAMKNGTKIFAPASGFVDSIYFDKFLGKTLVLNHLNGYKTLYAHLEKIVVFAKKYVERGEWIAYSGDSGYSLSPHLHYQITFDGKEISPLNIIKTGDKKNEK